MEGNIQEGTIKFYNAMRGYGFIIKDDGDEVFFHWKALPGNEPKAHVVEGDEVTFIEDEREDGLFTEKILQVVRNAQDVKET